MRALPHVFAELYRHRTLTEILVQRELKARYRGTALGFLWSFVNPLMMMAIYIFVFHFTMRLPVPHYGAFVLTGLLPWNAFVAGVLEGMNALVANGNLIRKVALPAEIFPLVAVSANAAHFLLSLPVLLLVLWGSGVGLGPGILWLPLLLLEQFVYATCLAVLLSSLAVQFRDLVHIVPNLVMMLFYVTPIIYPANMVPARLAPLVRYNPLAGLMENYRAVLLEGGSLALGPYGLRLVVGLTALGLCLRLFRARRDLYPELV